jgi:hypothetical protein
MNGVAGQHKLPVRFCQLADGGQRNQSAVSYTYYNLQSFPGSVRQLAEAGGAISLDRN